MNYESTVGILKSCIVSVKGGLPISALPADFENLTGETLDPTRFGYRNLKDLLASVPEISLKGTTLSVNDKKTDHLQKLISKQKGQTKFKVKKIKPTVSSAALFQAGASSSKRLGSESHLDFNFTRKMNLSQEPKRKETFAMPRPPMPPMPKDPVPSFMPKFASDCTPLAPPDGQVPWSRDSSAPLSRSTSRCSKDNLSDVDVDLRLATCLSISEPQKMAAGENGFGGDRLITAPVAKGRGRGWAANKQPGVFTGPGTSRRPSIDTRSRGDNYSTSSKSENSDDHEPFLSFYQMIGDSFLVKVSSLILSSTADKSEWADRSRLCKASLDIPSCLKQVRRSRVSPDGVIIMLGLTDILKGEDLQDVQQNMLQLLDVLSKQTSPVIILTVPIPPCLKTMRKALASLKSYNKFLLSLKHPNLHVVDLAPYTTDEDEETLTFLCDDTKSLDSWNESACWTVVEALVMENIPLSKK